MPHIVEYFRGVTSGLASKGKRHVHGVYGSRNVCAQVTEETSAAYSSVSGMSWGFSGKPGFPLPANRSFNQIKEYRISNSGDTFGLDRDAHRPGSDNGQQNINRVVSPAGDFLANIDQVFNLAKSYGNGDPNRLVTDFYRQARHAGHEWKDLIGEVDWSFIDYANDRGAELMSDFTDPFTGQTLGPQHLLATAAGHVLKPPLSDRSKANRGDVAGWAGDLMTFYGEWRRDSDSFASGCTYCTERLGKTGVDSSSGSDDLVEDADGFLLAEKMRSGVPITTVLGDHYERTGGVTRFRDCFAHRFATLQHTVDAAFDILTSIDDPLVNLGRIALETQTGGVAMVLSHLLPEGRLKNYCLGFAGHADRSRRTGGPQRGDDEVQPRRTVRPRFDLMGSWILAVLFICFGLAFVRFRKDRWLPGLVKASVATGTLCCLLGWAQLSFGFPSLACPDHFDRLEGSSFPLHATCYRDDGEQKELVSGWVNPLLFTCMAVLAGCLVALAVLTYRRYRKGNTR